MQKDLVRVPVKSLTPEKSAIAGVREKPTKILLICNDNQECHLISESITEAGFRAFAFEYTDQIAIGLDRLSRGGIDIIMCSLGALESQGHHVLARLHSQAPDVPIVVLAAHADGMRGVELLQQGAREIVFGGAADGRLLVGSVYRALERKRLSSELELKVRRLGTQLADLHNIVRDSAAGMIIVDQSGVVRFANPATEAIFFCSAKQLIGRCFEFIPDIEEGASEFTITASGQTRVVEVRVNRTQYRGELAYLALLRDITERKLGDADNRVAWEEAEARQDSLEESLSKIKEEHRQAQEEAEATKSALTKALSTVEEERDSAREEARATKKTLAETLRKAGEDRRRASEGAEATKKALEESLRKAEAEERLAREDAETTRRSLEKALSRTKEENSLLQDEAKATREFLTKALSKVEEERDLAREEAGATKKALEETMRNAEEDRRRAREEAEATKKAFEEALRRAEEDSRQAREETEATSQALKEAIGKAEEERNLAKETSRKVDRFKSDTAAVAEALGKAEQESKLARQETEKAKKSLAEALHRAEAENRAIKEEAEATKKTLQEALGKAEEERNLAEETLRKVGRFKSDTAAVAEALSRAEKESRVAREETGAAQKALEIALHMVEEEKKRAEEALRMADPTRSECMSNILHELRSPLHSIIGFVRLVLDDKVTDPETEKEFLTIINKQSEHLRDLIDELVDVSNTETDGFEVQKKRVSLVELLRSAVAELYGITSKRNILISQDIPVTLPEIDADEKRLRQVMFNLLDNAIKFSEDGSRITVTAEIRRGTLLVSVSDQGIGIAEEDMPAIFDRFYKTKDSASTGGLGLGLYISRQIIEAHGGRIWAESMKGKGSTFHFTLPLDQAKARADE